MHNFTFFKHRAQNRWQAFGVHLLISLTLFIVMCSIIVVFWYPGILFTTEGGWQGVRLIAGIDFVIGPTLTLIVYKVGKPSLKFDLFCIGLLQVLCITYGMYVVHGSRPAVIAYGDGKYYAIPIMRFYSRSIDTSRIDLFKGRQPIWVNIRFPEDQNARHKLKLDRWLAGIETSVDLYESYDHALPVLPKEGLSLDEAHSKYDIKIPDTLNKTGIRAYILYTRYGRYAIAVDTTTGEFISILKVFKSSDAEHEHQPTANTKKQNA